MSEYLDRAAEVLRETKVFRASAAFGVPYEAWGDCSRMMLRAALRAYQDLREWTVEELEALHTEALLVDRDNRPIHALPAQWWIRDGADLGPLRLVYNPDDLKEN